ncbi:MAG: tRNA (guanosine(37)-N1)-methyltransferase TrmD [Nakamurella sp.]
MRFDIITIFGEYLTPLRESLLGKAIGAGTMTVGIHDLRRWTHDVHRAVDDAPYGGGPGMVMKPDVWWTALQDVLADPSSPGTADDGPGNDPAPAGPATLIVPTPAGERFTQATAAELVRAERLVFACGRYEGIDQRFVERAASVMPVRELSIGDYVLAGGEVAVLVIIEAIARLIPGVLGNPDSAVDDSFGTGIPGLVEAPSYTRPPAFDGLQVPEVLRGGNHAAIVRHRRDESLRRTFRNRPDLFAALTAELLDAEDLAVLDEVGAPVPVGLRERVEAELAAKAAKKRRRRPRTESDPGPHRPM